LHIQKNERQRDALELVIDFEQRPELRIEKREVAVSGAEPATS